MLFNTHSELTFTQVKEMTNIDDTEIVQALLYLCSPKQKIIDKADAKKPEFSALEKLKVSSTFNNSNIRVVFIPTNTHKKKVAPEAGAGGIETNDDIRKERQNVIDSVIVRVMKARKTEKHNQVVEEVIRQISLFLAQPAMIKQRIESLIEREYLSRDTNDKSKYIYMP